MHRFYLPADRVQNFSGPLQSTRELRFDEPQGAAQSSPAPRQKRVAIVGSRAARSGAYGFAFELANRLAKLDVIVVSGGALGIDRAAHEGALDAGGVTWAFLPSGRLHPFPSENRDVFERIAKSRGALVYLFEDNAQASRGAFYKRNQALVAASDAVVVVQAAFKSGARNAAGHARRFATPLFAVGGLPWESDFWGCAEEIRLGAKPIVTMDALIADLLAPAQTTSPRLGGAAPRTAPRVRKALVTALCLPLTENTRVEPTDPVLRALGAQARHLDDLVFELNLPESLIRESLLLHALEGQVEEVPPGYYRLARL